MQEDLSRQEWVLKKYFEDFQPKNIYTWDDLEGYLTNFVQKMLLHSPENLLQVAYRLDLPEKEFTEAFYKQDIKQIVCIIIRKEKQRLEWRKKYQ
ncbi:MAG: hypothetical protein OHK0045_16450 [Raineya sp.]